MSTPAERASAALSHRPTNSAEGLERPCHGHSLQSSWALFLKNSERMTDVNCLGGPSDGEGLLRLRKMPSKEDSQSLASWLKLNGSLAAVAFASSSTHNAAWSGQCSAGIVALLLCCWSRTRCIWECHGRLIPETAKQHPSSNSVQHRLGREGHFSGSKYIGVFAHTAISASIRAYASSTTFHLPLPDLS